jgi:phage gpG-like protein
MKLDVEVKGMSKAVARIERLGQRAGDVRPVAHEVADVVARSNQRRFDSRGGGSWPPLSEDRQAQKAKAGQPAQPNVATGRLRHSLTEQPKVEATTDEIKIGSDVPYAPFVNYGTRTMPARKPTELRPSEKREVADIVKRHVTKGDL